ncbi:MAG: CHAT domain-containing protein [Nitrososphaerales archaeon]
MQDANSLPHGDRLSYLDFELEIGPFDGRAYPVSVVQSPAGEARESMRLPFDEGALEQNLQALQIAMLRSGGAYRRVLSREEASVQNFGRALFDALLAGELRSRYDISEREARRQGRGLRLKLRIQAPELAALPWEFMYDQRQAEYVALSRDHPVVRYLELPQAIEPLPVTPPLNIIGLVSSPCGLPELDAGREKRRTEAALQNLRGAGLVQLTWLAAPTWRHLHRAMRGGPWHILHFVGHGGFDPGTDEGIVALSDDDGRPAYLSATELGRLLADHHSLRLVLLNSCEGGRGSKRDVFSSTAAILVQRGVPAVVAMQYAITDQAATEFARAFYEALADGLPVDASVTEARKVVSLAVANSLEWGTPVLYMRAQNGAIFQFPAGTRPPASVRSPPPRAAEQRLERLYTDALSAFWAEDWDRAIQCFQAVLQENPSYPNAAARQEEARRQQKLAGWYGQALAAEDAGDWAAAEAALAKLAAEAADYKDAGARLAEATKRRQLAGLHDEALQLAAAEDWQAVVKVFGQIALLDSTCPDPDNLLPEAQRRVAELQRQADIDRLYDRAVGELDAGNWAAARDLLRQVQEQVPGLRDAERLLARAESEVARQEARTRRQLQVATLYEQAQALAGGHKWPQALAKMQEIASLDASFDDVQGIAEQARAALVAEEAEAQRESELAALYSEAVRLLRDRQYQAALEKWNQVQARDPHFPDRQKVQATSRRKLNELARPATSRSAAVRARGRELPARARAIGIGTLAVVAIAAAVWLAGRGILGLVVRLTATAASPAASPSALAAVPTSTPQPAVLGTPIPGCVPPPEGLIIWWPGDSNRENLAPGGPTAEGERLSWTQGWVDWAFKFESAGYEQAQAPLSWTAFEGIGALQHVTIEAWVRLDPDPSAVGRAEKFVEIHGKALLRKQDDGLLHFCAVVDGDCQHTFSREQLPRERWVHVAGTYDGRTVRLYMNGREVDHYDYSGVLGGPGDASIALSSNRIDPMQGLLDEVSIYDRALSAEAIGTIYAAGSAGKCKPAR